MTHRAGAGAARAGKRGLPRTQKGMGPTWSSRPDPHPTVSRGRRRGTAQRFGREWGRGKFPEQARTTLGGRSPSEILREPARKQGRLHCHPQNEHHGRLFRARAHRPVSLCAQSRLPDKNSSQVRLDLQRQELLFCRRALGLDAGNPVRRALEKCTCLQRVCTGPRSWDCDSEELLPRPGRRGQGP